jgi:hypothetical protein
MKTLIVMAALVGVMPAILQGVRVRGRDGETCIVLIDQKGAPIAVRCSRQTWEA